MRFKQGPVRCGQVCHDGHSLHRPNGVDSNPYKANSVNSSKSAPETSFALIGPTFIHESSLSVECCECLESFKVGGDVTEKPVFRPLHMCVTSSQPSTSTSGAPSLAILARSLWILRDSDLWTRNADTCGSPPDQARSNATVCLHCPTDVLMDLVRSAHCSRSLPILQATSFTSGAPLLLTWPGGDESS